ncbi:MAG TPA: C2H2-type zinc finger protein, partial [Dehalococcoidia bacterium]|nr:C2H2-type zinc finger protein [Dehalococcoidia bacterium]
MQEPQFRCPECGAEFPTQRSLEEHVMREHQGVQVKPPEQDDPADTTEFPSDRSIDESRERGDLP